MYLASAHRCPAADLPHAFPTAARRLQNSPAVYGRPRAERTITLTASLTPDEGGYVARCIELGVTTEGDTLDEAIAMLREAAELYLDGQPASEPIPHAVVTSFDVTIPAPWPSPSPNRVPSASADALVPWFADPQN